MLVVGRTIDVDAFVCIVFFIVVFLVFVTNGFVVAVEGVVADVGSVAVGPSAIPANVFVVIVNTVVGGVVFLFFGIVTGVVFVFCFCCQIQYLCSIILLV